MKGIRFAMAKKNSSFGRHVKGCTHSSQYKLSSIPKQNRSVSTSAAFRLVCDLLWSSDNKLYLFWGELSRRMEILSARFSPDTGYPQVLVSFGWSTLWHGDSVVNESGIVLYRSRKNATIGNIGGDELERYLSRIEKLELVPCGDN